MERRNLPESTTAPRSAQDPSVDHRSTVDLSRVRAERAELANVAAAHPELVGLPSAANRGGWAGGLSDADVDDYERAQNATLARRRRATVEPVRAELVRHDEAPPAVLAELERLRAENAKLRGDTAPRASEKQVRYLVQLLDRLSKPDAQAMIAYLKGWQGWNKRQQFAALLRLQAIPPRDAFDLLPDPRDAAGGAR